MILKIIGLVFGICPCCGKWFTYPKKRRLNTKFLEDENNWKTSCIDCFQKDWCYYEEVERDFYSSRI